MPWPLTKCTRTPREEVRDWTHRIGTDDGQPVSKQETHRQLLEQEEAAGRYATVYGGARLKHVVGRGRC
jgi:hypothetical protein